MSHSIDRLADVVVADPHPDAYEPIARQCNPAIRFAFVPNGRQALRRSATRGRTLWLVNSQLPDMTGFELYELLLERDDRSAVYLISNEFRSDEETRSRLLGVPFYGAKPPQRCWITDWAGGPGCQNPPETVDEQGQCDLGS